MPTPFMHLHVAEEMLQQLRAQNERQLQSELETYLPAFYLGHVAPDVNAISDIPREVSHFYHLPPVPDDEAYEVMLQQYPLLQNRAALQPAQAVFVAGYMAHLQLDLIWLRQIVIPFFFEREDLGDRSYRTLLHFILLTYLDMQAELRLPDVAEKTLAAAAPQNWLPFIPDPLLTSWRDALVPQLAPGVPSRTVEIYAARLKLTPAQFARNLQDQTWMQEHLFAKIPIDQVQNILHNAISPAVGLVKEYLH